MGIFATGGAKLSVTANTTPPATFDAAGYGALTYTEVKSKENLGSLGDESVEVLFDAIEEKRTKRIKGQRNANMLVLTCGLDDEDPGQIAMDAAEADDSSGDYHFKLELPNKRSSGGTNAIRYFSAKVFSERENLETANNVAKKVYNIGINTAIVRVVSS